MTARWLAVALAACGGCVAEADVDAYVVLPSRCADLGAAAVTFAVATADGEAFTVRADACTDRLANQEASGFLATIERLGPAYHRADVVVAGLDGGALGGRSLPFAGDAPLVLGLARADLPGWPTEPLTVTIPGCVAGGPVAELRLTATVVTGVAPEVDVLVACDGVMPAARVLELPRGPTVIVGEAACWAATADTVVGDGGAVELALTRSCP